MPAGTCWHCGSNHDTSECAAKMNAELAERRSTYSPKQSADIEAKLAAKDVEIERLKASHLQDVDSWRTALVETREALTELYCVTPMSVEETAIIQAVLAKYAALAGEANHD